MKPLDEYIRSNLDRFDTEEPLEGHFDRFTERLTQLEKRRFRQTGRVLLRIAAIVLIGLVISYAAIREFNLLKHGTDNIYSGSAGPELNEAEQFYTTQLNISYSKIQNLRFNNDQDEKKQVLQEFSEMDKQVRAMKQDLIQNPDDERIVHAIINFYQVKIEMMDMIIARTQQTTSSIL
jgi:hypothetical protein